MVSLEPVTKSTRNRSSAKRITPVDAAQQSFKGLPDSASLQASGDPPQSPAPSETSSTSATSSVGFNWHVRSTASIAQGSSSEKIGSDSNANRGINATIEILRGGCLPGDTLPIQVSVNHIKAVKSLQGIIITLYRLARVDTHPAIPLGQKTKDKKPEYEDYYPKSRTGLGGLSLSSAGSSRTFRQDLNQTFAPLIIDPRSLVAVVKTSIQVPEDLFPTIGNVPGEMISFKYYVEVVVDLRGKLASQDRVRSQLGIVNGAGGYGHGDPKVNGVDGSSGLFFPLASGFGCLDTSQVRREKSVVSWPFEIVIGTRDSDRKRCNKPSEPLQTPGSATTQTPPVSSAENVRINDHSGDGQNLQPASASPYHLEPDGYFDIPQHIASSPQYTEAVPTVCKISLYQFRICLLCHFTSQSTYMFSLTVAGNAKADLNYHLKATIPRPEEEADDGDEKARLRRAEQRLLPSQPPLDDEEGISMPEPSAPEAIDSEDFVYRYRMHQPRPSIPSAVASDDTIRDPHSDVFTGAG